MGFAEVLSGTEIFIGLEVWLEAGLSRWRSDWDWAVCKITVLDWRLQRGEDLEK